MVVMEDLKLTLREKIDEFTACFEITGNIDLDLDDSLSDDNSKDNRSGYISRAPRRVEHIKAPSPPRYPPPHSQGSPAFFPLSCVKMPQIEPEELCFALSELHDIDSPLADTGAQVIDQNIPNQTRPEIRQTRSATPAVLGVTIRGVDLNDPPFEIERVRGAEGRSMDSNSDSDSSEDESWGHFYTSRNYAAEREREPWWEIVHVSREDEFDDDRDSGYEGSSDEE